MLVGDPSVTDQSFRELSFGSWVQKICKDAKQDEITIDVGKDQITLKLSDYV